ncbi:MAG: glycosyltransferase family 2 protein, partial [Thermoplasmatota archaeon]
TEVENKDYNTPEEDESVLLGIPAYNEELSIGSVIHKSKKVDVVDDILVVDDGSTDETSEIAKDFGVKVIRHKKNAGKGAAIKTIFDYASENGYDYLVLIDGDGQHNPYEIPHVLSPALNPGADMVIGARWGDTTEMPFYRKIGKNVLDHLTPGGDKAKDTQSGFRALNKKAIEEIEIKQHDFTVESEMVTEAKDKDLDVTHSHISCRYDDVDNASTKGPVAHGLNVLSKIIRLTVERRPLVYLGIPGVISYLLGLITGIMVIRTAARHEVLSVGWGMLTIVFIVVGSVFVTSGFILNEIRRLMQQESREYFKDKEVVQE